MQKILQYIMRINFVRNGGAAIFANQARSVQTIIRRIIELDSRGYDLSGIRKCSNTLENEPHCKN